MSMTTTSSTADAQLRVNLAHLRENYHVLANAGAMSIGAVVKANAYGLGMRQVSEILWQRGCREFFTATLAEAFELRDLLPHAEIFVMSPSRNLDFDLLHEARVIPCLYALQQLRRLQRAALNTAPQIALHFDTGIRRLGLRLRDADQIADLAKHGNVKLLMSHYASADEPAAELNRTQRQHFHALVQRFPGVPVSMANSGGLLLGNEFAPGLSRVGISLYGVDQHGLNRVKPVATFCARVLQVRDLQPGDGVGYGHVWRAQVPTRVAVVAAGYADGVPRAWGSDSSRKPVSVAINGTVGEIVGRVSMDLTTVAVPRRASIATGDMIEFFGESIAIEQQAKAARTASYELLTRVGTRVERVYADR